MVQEEAKAWFSRNVEGCLDGLYGVAYRLTRNGADAEDLVAEAVAKAWASLATLQDRSRFKPWLFRILNNCYISDYRKKAVRPIQYGYDELGSDDEEDLTELLIRLPDDFLGWWGSPEHELANRLMAADIVTAIERLPEAYRVTVVLVNVEGLSYDEAAEVLGVPPGTVRSRMKRGRTLLQKALWEHAREAGLIGDEHREAGTT
ncbi:MAG: sigma-70 family RNA polymerase sigma factor [Gammaproteobacteria bacterium]|jgi:RNA polymerase sigma-70 factor (ECF subfamily)|nr:sigma-70 family RNA polymerase sigma factor [Gammaproteobacteria bacterium]